jgi:DNA-binding PadR family transcriptional regulator
MAMPKETLPDLERLVLLAILHCGEEAYGVPVMEEIRVRTGRRVLRPAVYETLKRLERKGLVTTRRGDPSPKRGGRARTFYAVSEAGLAALRKARESWGKMWQGLEHIAGGVG